MRQKMERETEEWWPQRRMREEDEEESGRIYGKWHEPDSSTSSPHAALLLCSAINVLVAAALAENKVAAARPR